MGREAKRVPLDFGWPLRETWEGYLMPEWLGVTKACECYGTGLSPRGIELQAIWYGRARFVPEDNGSTAFGADHPAIRAQAERNVALVADEGIPIAVDHEAQRLAALVNRRWAHHLNADDIEALGERAALDVDVTDPRAFNEANLTGLGLDSISAHACIRARCEREGEPHTCAACDGYGAVEAWAGQRATADAWQSLDPPAGDGWQMWETTSEGSPTSPVFATAEELAAWCAEHATVFGSVRADAAQWLAIITGADFAHVEIAPGVVIM